jgi:hypothetical protein
MPVVAMLRGRGRRAGALRSRTGPLLLLAAPVRPDMAEPGRDVVVEFSRDRPGMISKLGSWTGQNFVHVTTGPT